MKLFKHLCLLLTVCTLWSCDMGRNGKQQEAKRLLAAVKDSFVQDQRTGVFDVEAVIRGRKVFLKGATTSPEGKQEALYRFKSAGWQVADNIRLLPDTLSGKKIYGIINHSVVPMNSTPQFSAEMTTQGLLGMPVHILEGNSWLRVQMPDNYIAWALSGYIQKMTCKEYNNWQSAPKVIFLSHYGNAYSAPDLKSQTVSDLVSGCMLRLVESKGNFYKIAYPDGREGYILKKEAKKVEEWQKGITLTAESLIRTAYSLNGVPYLWGGTSAKGVDCSGFIKIITFLHGLILQRDASQQANTGIQIDISQGYDNLQPGDLLFFGEKASIDKKERIIHVGLYTGNLNFIHSINNVHTSSLDPQSTLYDQYNTERLIRACRILGAVGTKGITPIQDNPFYQPQ